MSHSTLKRPSAPGRQKRAKSRSTFDSIVTLARWQWRATWKLLSVVGVGLLLAVILACAIPLYAQVALSAGIEHMLEQNPQNRYITVHAQSPLFNSNTVRTIGQAITNDVQGYMGNDVTNSSSFSIQIAPLELNWQDSFDILGMDVGQAKSHLTLLHGHLPAATSKDIVEFVTTAQGANDLHLQIGKVLTLS